MTSTGKAPIEKASLAAFAIDDPGTAAWWHAAERGELLLQRCTRCTSHQHYPRPLCTHCGSTDLLDVVALGRGTIYSLTTVRMSIHPELDAPYCLALITLEEGPRLLTTVDPGAQIDDEVTMTWLRRGGLPVHHFIRLDDRTSRHDTPRKDHR